MSYKDQLLEFLKYPKMELPPLVIYDTSIWIVGAGGVASWLLPQLLKILYTTQKPWRIKIFDQDTVEHKNILRQNFIPEDVGKNKAEVLAERYSDIYKGITIEAVPYYMYSSGFCERFDKKPLGKAYETFAPPAFVFNMMDNGISKHMLDYYLVAQPSVRYFCSGCSIYHGSVFSTLTHYLPTYTEYYADTFEEEGGLSSPSCADVVEQTFNTNAMAATIIATLFSNSLVKQIDTQEIRFTATDKPHMQSYPLKENLYVTTPI